MRPSDKSRVTWKEDSLISRGEIMKKVLLLTLTITIAIMVFAACGQKETNESGISGNSSDFDPDKVKTMGDAFAYTDDENVNEGFTETHYVCIIDVGGVKYRAVAEMPEDVSEEVWAIDFEDENRTEKQRELVAPLELSTFENLTEQMPGQDELDKKYVGRTGQDLFDEGWVQNYYNLEDMEAGFDYGPYCYTVRFEYDGPRMENTDDFDFEKEFKGLKIRSLTCDGIGQGATDVE